MIFGFKQNGYLKQGEMMKYIINASVGKGGRNNLKDVKIVQALLNVYLRREKSTLLKVTGKYDHGLQGIITSFQNKEMKSMHPDGRVDPAGRTFNHLLSVLSEVLKDNLPLIKPKEGVVTFDSEGAEGGPYHSRILHVPGPL